MNTRKLVLPVEVEWQPEGVYYAECSLIPGCHAEAETLGEVLEIIQDVARVLLEFRRDHGLPIPEVVQQLAEDRPLREEVVIPFPA